ncbi:MAG: hypothetical protein WA979_06395 [Pacificimonas sp.]
MTSFGFPVSEALLTALTAMFSQMAAPSVPTQGKTGSEHQQRQMPISSLSSFHTQSWASMGTEGARSRFQITVSGREAQVDAMAAQLEADLTGGDHDLGDALLADIVRTDTDKTVDGSGNAVSLLTFEALTIRE